MTPATKELLRQQHHRYTPSMTTTTIKVDAALRDRLKASAAANGSTMAQEIERLLEVDERRAEVARWHAQVRANPPDAEYWREFEEWERLTPEP